MLKSSFVLLVAVTIAGCALYGSEIPVDAVKTIQTNVTTREQIMAKFGEPFRTGLDSGFETWRYTFRGVSKTDGWLERDLYIIFNKNLTVHKYSFGTNKPGPRTGSSAR